MCDKMVMKSVILLTLRLAYAKVLLKIFLMYLTCSCRYPYKIFVYDVWELLVYYTYKKYPKTAVITIIIK